MNGREKSRIIIPDSGVVSTAYPISKINAVRSTEVGLVKYDTILNKTPTRSAMFDDVCTVCSFAERKLSALSPRHLKRIKPTILLESIPAA